jgi:hypothetical protein
MKGFKKVDDSASLKVRTCRVTIWIVAKFDINDKNGPREAFEQGAFVVVWNLEAEGVVGLERLV